MHPYQHPLFVNFMVYFNQNQDYFECHEVLEEYWKSLPDGDKEHPLTAYILLATGMYHWRRGNTSGATRTIRKALVKFKAFNRQSPLYAEEIDFRRLVMDVQQIVNRLGSALPFQPFPITVHSPKLARLICEATREMELLPFGSDAVIHKHMLRDRSDILLERHRSASDPEARRARRKRLDEEKKKGRRN